MPWKVLIEKCERLCWSIYLNKELVDKWYLLHYMHVLNQFVAFRLNLDLCGKELIEPFVSSHMPFRMPWTVASPLLIRRRAHYKTAVKAYSVFDWTFRNQCIGVVGQTDHKGNIFIRCSTNVINQRLARVDEPKPLFFTLRAPSWSSKAYWNRLH